MTSKKTPTSYALTNEAKKLLRKIADHLGISQSAALEVVIREYAERVGLR